MGSCSWLKHALTQDIWFALKYQRTTTADRNGPTMTKHDQHANGSGNQRSLRANRNTLAMFAIKAVSIVVNLLMVRVLLNTLDAERYGIWMTLSSLVAWLGFFDVGVGHGLRNKLAAALAKGDTAAAQSHISTAYLSMIAISTLLLAVALLLAFNVSWSMILNAPASMENELQALAAWVVSLFLVQLFLKLLNSIMLAMQMPAASAFITTLGQAVSLAAIAIVIQFDLPADLTTLGFIIFASPVAVLFVASAILFIGPYAQYAPSPSAFQKAVVWDIFALGIQFFLIQITALLLFETSTFLIAQTCGPSCVTEYSVAYKYVGVVYMLFTIVTTPYWSAATEAYVKRDMEWIAKSLRFLNILWVLFVLFGIVLVSAAGPIYKIWLGMALSADPPLLAAALVYYLLLMRWAIFGSILNGIGKVRLQFYITVVEAVVHVPLAYLLGRLWGVFGVLGSMTLVALVNVIWPPMQLRKVLTGSAHGIWNK